MKLKFFSLIFFTVVSASICTSQTIPELEKLDDAVVLVKIYDDKGNKIGHGSGFCIDSKGIVVTNYHVIESAFTIEVYFEGGNQYIVENIISGSKELDLVKLQLKIPETTTLPFLKVATVFPKKGEKCWSIGTPAEETYFNTVASGDVSNLYLESNPQLIQTNAKIAHGSSGGALLNSKGEVIGVTTWGDVSEDGARADINFAVWVGELNELTPINKKTLVVIEETPYCDISFFTRYKFNDQVYIYVDGKYIGELTVYFDPTTVVTCFMAGTVSIRLPVGAHSYSVHWAQNDSWVNGQVTLTDKQCKLFEVLAPVTFQEANVTYPEWNWPKRDRTKYLTRLDKKWATGIGVPIVAKIIAYRYLNDHSFALRIGGTILSQTSFFEYPYVAVDFDFIKIWKTNKTFRPYLYIAPRFEYRNWPSSVKKEWYLGPGAGFEANMGKRLFLYFDINYLFSLKKTGSRPNGNLGLGFRF